jgi:hypothetical protein
VAEGTLIEVYPTSQCHGGYAHASSWPQAAETLAMPGPAVIGAFPFGQPEANAFFYGDYAVIATIGFIDPPKNAGAIFVGKGGITGIHVGCASTADALIEQYGLGPEVDFDALSPALAPSTGGGSSGPSAPVTLAVALGVIAAALLGVGLSRRHTYAAEPP